MHPLKVAGVAEVTRGEGQPASSGFASLAASVEPLLVDTGQAATICAVSTASWFRLKAAGKIPAPVKLGGRVLYRVEDLKLWVAMGCPDRKEFEARKTASDSSDRPR